jgi:hypothetical protein
MYGLSFIIGFDNYLLLIQVCSIALLNLKFIELANSVPKIWRELNKIHNQTF